MLPILLASFLAAGSFDNVLVDTSVVAPTKAPDTAVAACDGPLKGKVWGLGFRVLGDAPEIVIHGALGARTSLSLQAVLRGNAFEEPGNKERLRGDSSLFDLELSAPLRTRFACDGRLCATASIGPLLRIIESEGKHDYVFRDTTTWGETSSRSEIRYGVTGALGATMEIFPGVFVASECGLKGWFATGDQSQTSYYPISSGIDDMSREGDISNKGMSSWFGGIGLDVWF